MQHPIAHKYMTCTICTICTICMISMTSCDTIALYTPQPQGNRRYIKCLYVYNKIDVCSMEEVDEIARRPYSIPISCYQQLNLDGLLRQIWDMMALVRVYTKKVCAVLQGVGCVARGMHMDGRCGEGQAYGW